MRNPCEVIEIITPKKFILNGLWFGPEKPKRAIIFVHGLTSSVLSNKQFISSLADRQTAALAFNNRGHDIISKAKKIDKRKKKGYRSIIAGAAHEIFTDCVDDIQGAVKFIRNRKVLKEIFLMGHSTGCQKSIYYLAQKGKQKNIKGVILLAPLSDYSTILKETDKNVLKKAQDHAKRLVKLGKSSNLLPEEIWPETIDAQRFLSLYTPDSPEEIFTYCQKDKKPTTFQKIKIPVLAIFAEKDEYRDRPTKKIVEWFSKISKSRSFKASIIKNAPHSFYKYEKEVVKEIKNWL